MTGRWKFFWIRVKKSGMYGSQSIWPTVWLASRENSAKQL
jgi:hypothetical protein